jgi:hypothetical protein
MSANYQFTTDIMEQQFGPLKLSILLQNKDERIAKIAMMSDNKPLEIAHVSFRSETAEKYNRIHAEITGGAMMGKTLRSHKLQVTRRELAHFVFRDRLVRNGFPGHTYAVVKVAELLVGEHDDVYARNIEFYSPDVQWGEPEFGQHEFESTARRSWKRVLEKGIGV